MSISSRYYLILAKGYPPSVGGLETYAALLAEGLGVKHRVDVLTFWDGETASKPVDTYAKVRRLKPSTNEPVSWLRMTLTLLSRLIKHDLPDVVVAVTWKVGLAYIPLKWLVRRPLLVIAHGAEITRHAHSKYLVFLMHIVFRLADRVIAISKFTSSVVCREIGVAPEQVTVVPNGIDVERFNPIDSTEAKRKLGLEDRMVLLTVSRLDARKGHDRMLLQLSDLWEHHPELEYCIVGDGPRRQQLEIMVKDLQLPDSIVRFVGQVPDDLLDLYYSAADVFVMLNLQTANNEDFEGFGFVFAEAGLFGKPCLGGDNAGVRDVIMHGKTGFLVDPDNAGAVRTFLERLCRDPDLRARLGANAREHVIANLTVSKMIAGVEGALHDLAST